MVDRVDKLFPEPSYRVNASRDALEEERGEGDGADADDGAADNFDKLRDGKDLQTLFDKPHLWERNVEIKVEDIDKIKILGVNLRTEPSLLKVRLFFYDGTIIPTAFLSISRSLGLKIRTLKQSSFIDANLLTKEAVFRVTIPKDEREIDEEITKITGGSKEKTFSQTFKRLIAKRTWLQRLGIQDPVSQQMNSEILWVYITVIVLITVVTFGILFLML